MTTYKFCTSYNAGEKKNYTGSVCPSCSQSLQAFLLPTSLHIFLLFKQSFLKRHGAAFTQDTGPQCTKWRTRKVWRALLAGPLASLVLKYHTETAFCSGSISYFRRDKALRPGICTVFALPMQGEATASTSTLSSITADDVQISWPIWDKVPQHSTEFNPCVKVECKRASGSARRPFASHLYATSSTTD